MVERAVTRVGDGDRDPGSAGRGTPTSSSGSGGTAGRPRRAGRAPRVPAPLLVVVAAACWGTGGLAGSLLARGADLSPVAVGSYRLLVAAVALVALAALRRQLPALLAAVRAAVAHRGDAARLAVVGVGLAVFQACYFVAVDALGVSVATLLTLGSAPVLVTLGAAVVLRERVGVRLAVALPLAVGGLALLVDLSPPGQAAVDAGRGAGAGAGAVGVVVALVSATGYAAVTLAGRSLAARVGADHVTTTGFVVAAAVSLPVGAGVGLGFAPTASAVALVVYLGLVPTAVAYTAFFAGLRGTASGAAAVLTLVEPLTATVLAVLLLGERLGPAQLLGALLLGAVVVLLAAPARRRAPAGGAAPGAPAGAGGGPSTS